MPTQTIEDINAAHKEHVNDFHVAHSKALMAWQQIEDNMFLIFSSLLNSKTNHIDSAIFYAVNNVHGRLKMIAAAFKMYPNSDTHAAAWKKLAKEVRAKSEYRNNLAHCTTSFNFDDNDNPFFLLEISAFDASHEEIKVDIPQMLKWQKSFELLAAELMVFSSGMDDTLLFP